MNTSAQHPDCLSCKHYFVTWDKNFPYGCRAMEFKSKVSPAIEVFQSSGMVCQRFEPKRASKRP